MRWSTLSRPAEDFLVSSRLRRNDVEFEASIGNYLTQSASLLLSYLDRNRHEAAQVELPDAIPLRMDLSEALRRRRSIRHYTGEPISLRYLGTLLSAGGGITGKLQADGMEVLTRSTPSAGGLYPVSLHLASLSVTGLPRSVYLYDPHNNCLWETGTETTVESLMTAVAAPDTTITTSRAAAIIMLIGRPWRSMRKYGDRGMRHTLIEAGMVAQNLHLAAAALGIGTVDSASFYDDEVHEALSLDGAFEVFIHAVVVGVPGD